MSTGEYDRDVAPDAYDVRRYFSSADHGSVLITTRLARLEQLGDSQLVSKVNRDQAEAIFQNWYKGKYGKVQYTVMRTMCINRS